MCLAGKWHYLAHCGEVWHGEISNFRSDTRGSTIAPLKTPVLLHRCLIYSVRLRWLEAELAMVTWATWHQILLLLRCPRPKNVIKTIAKWSKSCGAINISKEALLKGTAKYNWPPHKGSLFCNKSINIFSIKMSWSKPVRARRSTLLSLPLELGFPYVRPRAERSSWVLLYHQCTRRWGRPRGSTFADWEAASARGRTTVRGWNRPFFLFIFLMSISKDRFKSTSHLDAIAPATAFVPTYLLFQLLSLNLLSVLLPCSCSAPALLLPCSCSWPAPALLLSCSCHAPAPALLLPCSCPAPTLLLPYSCLAPAMLLKCPCPAPALLLPMHLLCLLLPYSCPAPALLLPCSCPCPCYSCSCFNHFCCSDCCLFHIDERNVDTVWTRKTVSDSADSGGGWNPGRKLVKFVQADIWRFLNTVKMQKSIHFVTVLVPFKKILKLV